MKTSIILIAALVLNTTLLVAEPLSTLVQSVNPVVFLSIESVLVLGYFLNLWLKRLNEAYKIDLGYLNVFVLKSTDK